MNDAAPSELDSGRPWPLIVAIAMITLLLAGIVGWTSVERRHISNVHTAALEAGESSLFVLSTTHRKLDQMIAEGTINSAMILQRLDDVDGQLQRIHALADHTHIYQRHPVAKLHAKITAARAMLGQLRALAKKRMAEPAVNGPGSASDLDFNQLYTQLRGTIQQINIALDAERRAHVRFAGMLQEVSLVLILLAGLCIIWLVLRYDRRRRHDFAVVQEAQAKLLHVQRLESLGVLAGGIAHDFNNLLTAIMGNSALARDYLPEESQAHEYLARIENTSRRAADLCQQMLAYSGKGRFVVKPVNLSNLVEEMTHLLHVSIGKSIVLQLDLPKSLPPIDADVAQVQQVVMNLVTNASEAIGDKSGVITIATGLMDVDAQYMAGLGFEEGQPAGRYVYLEVSDTGCGMDEGTRERIFEPFFTTKFTGRGLGMAAVLGIVRGHKGAIKVYSEPGNGSSFKVLFPRSAAEAAIDMKAPRPQEESTWRGQGTVLVVDDEESIREIAAMALERAGFKVLLAVDGIEGVEVFREHHDEIVAVLLDMTMPRMGGEDVFAEMRQIDPEAKVILTSGYNEQHATNRFAGKNLAGFIKKPYNPGMLIQKFMQVLSQDSGEA